MVQDWYHHNVDDTWQAYLGALPKSIAGRYMHGPNLCVPLLTLFIQALLFPWTRLAVCCSASTIVIALCRWSILSARIPRQRAMEVQLLLAGWAIIAASPKGCGARTSESKKQGMLIGWDCRSGGG